VRASVTEGLCANRKPSDEWTWWGCRNGWEDRGGRHALLERVHVQCRLGARPV